MGKPITVSRKVDLRSAPEAIEYFAGMAGKIEGRTVPVPGRFLNYTVREPYGVVAGIIPWNYPLLQAIWKIAPAVMAGNTVVLKPAEQAPLSPMALVRLAHEAGFPPGVVNAVTGYGPEAGAALCRHPDVALIAFTGSVETGQAIQRMAADRVVPVTLELGGKTPNIVFEDANLKSATAMAYAAIFTNQGEVCTAGSRLLVHESVHDQVVSGLLELIGKQTVIGDPMDEATTLGPLLDAEQLKRVQGFVEPGQGRGHHAAGRRRNPPRRGPGQRPVLRADRVRRRGQRQRARAERGVRAGAGGHQVRRRGRGGPAGQRRALRARRGGADP